MDCLRVPCNSSMTSLWEPISAALARGQERDPEKVTPLVKRTEVRNGYWARARRRVRTARNLTCLNGEVRRFTRNPGGGGTCHSRRGKLEGGSELSFERKKFAGAQKACLLR